ncbi:hypothetical protein EAI_04509 [Harpegnathos saltator]|uniref:Uncharacterized protein n=1 Tax=Harpegnathos saltator TaxID=610380 RepID=E2B4W4_HARSA|nr:hypothetical protein EAI_04509 [Harpegnathos saltator]
MVTSKEEERAVGEEVRGVFKQGRKIQRSPHRKEEEGGGEETGWCSRMMEEWTKEVKEGLQEMKKALREEVRKQGKEMKKEREKLRKQMEEREIEWKRERKEMRGKIERLEEETKGGEGRREERKVKEIWERMRGMERRIEINEREERRKNVIIGGLRGGEKEVGERLRKMFKDMGIKVEVKGVKRIGRGKENEEGRIMMRMDRVKEEKEIMLRRRELREKGIRIDDDLTWRERKMRWKLEEIAREERERGKSIWGKYGKIQIDGKWWRCNEEEEELRDSEGRTRGETGER